MDPKRSQDPGATESVHGRAPPAHKHPNEQRQYAENEGLVNQTTRKTPDALKGEELEEATWRPGADTQSDATS